MLGDGNRSLISHIDYEMQDWGLMGYNLSLLDTDNDQDLDVIKSFTGTSNRMVVLQNVGSGRFEVPITSVKSVGGDKVLTTDFDHDGNLDLVSIGTQVVNITGTNMRTDLSVLFGDGTGGFGQIIKLEVPNNGSNVAVLDIDNDGFDDVVAFSGSNLAPMMSVFRNDGLRGFTLRRTLPLAHLPEGKIESSYVEKNGNPELIYVSKGNTYFLRGSKDFNFSAPRLVDGVQVGVAGGSATAGYLNNDEFIDIVTSSSSGFSVQFSKDGSLFSAATYYGTSVARPLKNISLGDVDGDGDLDVIGINSNTLQIAVNESNATFSFREPIAFDERFTEFYGGSASVPREVTDLRIGDLNGDGNLDFVIADGNFSFSFQGYGGALVLFGDGHSGILSQTDYKTLITPQSLVVGDFNNDKLLDVVGSSSYRLSVDIMINKGNGDFGRFGSSGTFANAIRSRETLGGGAPDGYAALQQALTYPARASAKSFLVLISPNSRSVRDGRVSFASIAESISNSGSNVAFIIDAKFVDANGCNPILRRMLAIEKCC